MITHDVSDGSGGLDGSIAYELGREAVRLVLRSTFPKFHRVLI